jgi:hypothetical protein
MLSYFHNHTLFNYYFLSLAWPKSRSGIIKLFWQQLWVPQLNSWTETADRQNQRMASKSSTSLQSPGYLTTDRCETDVWIPMFTFYSLIWNFIKLLMFEHSSIEQMATGIVNFLPAAIQCPVKCEKETCGGRGNVRHQPGKPAPCPV